MKKLDMKELDMKEVVFEIHLFMPSLWSILWPV